jgi:Spy/CpxP family protein refolding chaperone
LKHKQTGEIFMKMRMTLFAVVLASGGIVSAAETHRALDLNTLQASPLEILEGLAPQKHDERDKDKDSDDKKAADMPQACTDAAITPEQKTKIEDAVYQAVRAKVQLDADLKLAVMTYAHTVKDQKSDLAAAQVASTQVTDAIGKIAVAHMNLGTHILYEIVTPEQRPKAFECLKELHKKNRNKKK